MKTLSLMVLVCLLVLVGAAPALAQGTDHTSYFLSGAAVGAGWGFGRIGAAALEGMARQPEVAPRIQTAMIIIAALLEGATFVALVICILMTGTAKF